MPLNLFIDTNIFLSFFHLSSDDLEELRKLSVLLAKGKITLYLPAQVVDEFARNRDGKVADGMKRLREQRLNLQYPQICKDYLQYKDLQRLQRKFEEAHNLLLDQLTADIASQNLKADIIVGELFQSATRIETAAMIERARTRMDLGNPPGKAGSLGDAVNWESLLDAVPPGDSLHFITDDKDFASPLPGSPFDSFLLVEWKAKKKSDLVAYPRLSEFFKAQFPEIKLASEAEKDLLIADLAKSWSFADTHATVAKLNTFSEFSDAQATAVVSAALTNNQVGWIIGDSDVNHLVKSVIRGRENKLDRESADALAEMLASANDADSPS